VQHGVVLLRQRAQPAHAAQVRDGGEQAGAQDTEDGEDRAPRGTAAQPGEPAPVPAADHQRRGEDHELAGDDGERYAVCDYHGRYFWAGLVARWDGETGARRSRATSLRAA
jgi:hypothetical protein